MDSREPWDRLPGEPKRAYAYFCAYRDLGLSRTLQAAAAKGQVKVGYLGKLSSRWKWVHRADQWDAWQEKERNRAARRKAVLEARLEARVVSDLLKTAAIAVNRLLKEVASENTRVSARTTLELAETALKLRRLRVEAPAAVESLHDAGSARQRLMAKIEAMAAAFKAADAREPRNGNDDSLSG